METIVLSGNVHPDQSSRRRHRPITRFDTSKQQQFSETANSHLSFKQAQSHSIGYSWFPANGCRKPRRKPSSVAGNEKGSSRFHMSCQTPVAASITIWLELCRIEIPLALGFAEVIPRYLMGRKGLSMS